eukprot:SAG31_NODE_27132_length_430_cov_40.737160_1_plen_143_part_11
MGESDEVGAADFVDFRGLGGPLQSPILSQPTPPPTSSLQQAEFELVQSGSPFGLELSRLLAFDDGPVQQSELHLDFWLRELSLSATPLQAAHAYFGISRGLRFLPRSHRRQRTHSTNYYKHEHARVVDKEFDRLLHAGFVAPV